MKPAPQPSVIKTVSRPSVQHVLLALVGFALATYLVSQVLPGITEVVSEVGRLMLGLSKR